MNSNANVMETVEQAVLPTEEAARTAARAGSREFRNLIADVEDLIKRVAHVDDQDLARARAKLENDAGRRQGVTAQRQGARQDDRAPCCREHRRVRPFEPVVGDRHRSCGRRGDRRTPEHADASVNIVAALPRIAPVLARHALGYADLATEELQDAGAVLRRRVLAAAMYAIAASFSVLMFCCLAIAVAWDTALPDHGHRRARAGLRHRGDHRRRSRAARATRNPHGSSNACAARGSRTARRCARCSQHGRRDHDGLLRLFDARECRARSLRQPAPSSARYCNPRTSGRRTGVSRGAGRCVR